MKRIASLVVIFVVGTSLLYAQDKNWKKTLEAKLKEIYVPSKVAMMDPGKVNTLGTVLTIQKTGIGSDRSDAMAYQRAHVIDGELKGENQGAKEGTYVLPAGTKVYLRTVSLNDQVIDFHIYTVDPVERSVAGTTRSDRYTAMVRFEFAKDYLATATLDDIQKAISVVLATDAQALASKTIELGQTQAQIEAMLGKPENIIKLGPKTTYVYKTMKIIFVDGKVSDVQ